MSEKMTMLEPTSQRWGGMQVIGHVTRLEVQEQARLHYEAQRKEAQIALEALSRGEFRVFQQRGVYVPRNRREVV